MLRHGRHGYTRLWVHGEIVVIGAPQIAGQFAVPRLGTVDPYMGI